MESKDSSCSELRPATSRERRICEDVVNDVARLKERAGKECGWFTPKVFYKLLVKVEDGEPTLKY